MTSTTKPKNDIDTRFEELAESFGWILRKRRRPIGKGKWEEYGEKLWISECHGCEIPVDELKTFIKEEIATNDKKWEGIVEGVIGYIGDDEERKLARSRLETLQEEA